MADTDSWSAESSKALEISLVGPSSKGQGLSAITRFNPKFTYPIFGDDERIFGYQDLKINLRFHACDMRPNLEIKHSKKLKSIGDTEPTDIEGLMHEFLPDVAFAKSREFEAALRALPADWTPPGEVLTNFGAKDGGSFEVRHGLMSDAAIKQIHNRVQILVPLFIEGGTYIDTEGDGESRWEVFFLYYKKPSTSTSDAPPYQLAGYTTVYKFFPLRRHHVEAGQSPSRDDLDLPVDQAAQANLKSRNRISQFVIMPPFQKAGNGARLYSAIYEHYLGDSNVMEVTVEDPNEAFDDMRDVADLGRLRQTPEFVSLRINTDLVIPKSGAAPRNIIDEESAEATRMQYKIAPRQFYRVLEMHLMSKLADSVRPTLIDEKTASKPTKTDEHAYQLWRLYVKERLYRRNKEILSQLDRSERIDKVNETLGSVELEYARLLALLEKRSSGDAEGANGKRKLEENGDDETTVTSKKARVEDA